MKKFLLLSAMFGGVCMANISGETYNTQVTVTNYDDGFKSMFGKRWKGKIYLSTKAENDHLVTNWLKEYFSKAADYITSQGKNTLEDALSVTDYIMNLNNVRENLAALYGNGKYVYNSECVKAAFVEVFSEKMGKEVVDKWLKDFKMNEYFSKYYKEYYWVSDNETTKYVGKNNTEDQDSVNTVANHFDYDNPYKDGYDVSMYIRDEKLTETRINEYVNKYCVGDYAKYKDIIKNDTNLLLAFVWSQCCKDMSLKGKFKEGFGLVTLRIIMKDVEKYFKWGSKDNDIKDIRGRIRMSGRKKYEGIDREIESMISEFLSVLCYCEYDADTPEAKKQFVDVLRNDVINTAKAHYENLLKFIKDNYNGDKDIGEFVISLCAENLRDYKAKNFNCNDGNGKEVSFPNSREAKKIKNDLCDELMDYLRKLCVQYGIDDMKNGEVFTVDGEMFAVLEDIRFRKKYAEEAAKSRPQYKAENAKLKPKIAELEDTLNQNTGFHWKSFGTSVLNSVWNGVTYVVSAPWNVIKYVSVSIWHMLTNSSSK